MKENVWKKLVSLGESSVVVLKKKEERWKQNRGKSRKVHKLEGEGPTKAFCDLLIVDTFLVKGLRVVEGKDGLFLSMPRQQGKDGKWYDTVCMVSKEMRKGLEKMVIGEYQTSLAG